MLENLQIWMLVSIGIAAGIVAGGVIACCTFAALFRWAGFR